MKHLLLFFLFALPFCVCAQLHESFDKPTVTASYPWEGTPERFRVNDQGELQLYTLQSSGKAWLALASTRLYANEWQCTMRSDYQGTVQNYFQLYLWCREPSMDNPGEAVFVRLGYTKKSVALCYQQGNLKPEVLLEGRVLFTDPTQVDVKVTTDGKGQCTLYTRNATESAYHTEGMVELPTGDSKGYFMVGMTYSGQHSRDKYVDNLYVRNFTLEGNRPEPTPGPAPGDAPQITQLDHTADNTLQIEFDQPVVADYASFTLSHLGEVNAIGITDDGLMLELIWEAPLEKGKTYLLTYSDLLDEAGNNHSGTYTFIATYSETVSVDPDDTTTPVVYAFGDMLLNEVMADPKGLTSLPETEYVELHNTTERTIILDGWQFRYGDTRVVLPNQAVLAQGYAVLYRAGRSIHLDPGGTEMPLATFPAQLANTGKALQLTDATGKLIDRMEYGQAKPGISWERQGSEWILSADPRGGTPGSLNSTPEEEQVPVFSTVEPQEIVFNELLPDPFVGGAEYIELYNRSGKTLPVKGLSVATRRSDGTLATAYPLDAWGATIQPEGFLVLTKSATGVRGFYPVPDTAPVHEMKMPVLANTAATLVLVRQGDGVVVDEVSYTAQWHDPAVKDMKGVALERIDPDKPAQDPANWTSATSTAGHGTPGGQNSQYKNTAGSPAGIDAPVYDPLTGDYRMLYAFEEAGYQLHARVFDLSGRQVAVITNNEPAGVSGRLVWNGMGSDGSRLIPGVYIFYVECTHLSGWTRQIKLPLLVH